MASEDQSDSDNSFTTNTFSSSSGADSSFEDDESSDSKSSYQQREKERERYEDNELENGSDDGDIRNAEVHSDGVISDNDDGETHHVYAPMFVKVNPETNFGYNGDEDFITFDKMQMNSSDEYERNTKNDGENLCCDLVRSFQQSVNIQDKPTREEEIYRMVKEAEDKMVDKYKCNVESEHEEYEDKTTDISSNPDRLYFMPTIANKNQEEEETTTNYVSSDNNSSILAQYSRTLVESLEKQTSSKGSKSICEPYDIYSNLICICNHDHENYTNLNTAIPNVPQSLDKRDHIFSSVSNSLGEVLNELITEDLGKRLQISAILFLKSRNGKNKLNLATCLEIVMNRIDTINPEEAVIVIECDHQTPSEKSSSLLEETKCSHLSDSIIGGFKISKQGKTIEQLGMFSNTLSENKKITPNGENFLSVDSIIMFYNPRRKPIDEVSTEATMDFNKTKRQASRLWIKFARHVCDKQHNRITFPVISNSRTEEEGDKFSKSFAEVNAWLREIIKLLRSSTSKQGLKKDNHCEYVTDSQMGVKTSQETIQMSDHEFIDPKLIISKVQERKFDTLSKSEPHTLNECYRDEPTNCETGVNEVQQVEKQIHREELSDEDLNDRLQIKAFVFLRAISRDKLNPSICMEIINERIGQLQSEEAVIVIICDHQTSPLYPLCPIQCTQSISVEEKLKHRDLSEGKVYTFALSDECIECPTSRETSSLSMVSIRKDFEILKCGNIEYFALLWNRLHQYEQIAPNYGKPIAVDSIVMFSNSSRRGTTDATMKLKKRMKVSNQDQIKYVSYKCDQQNNEIMVSNRANLTKEEERYKISRNLRQMHSLVEEIKRLLRSSKQKSEADANTPQEEIQVPKRGLSDLDQSLHYQHARAESFNTNHNFSCGKRREAESNMSTIAMRHM